jgi:hypothetical protein
MSTFGCMTGEWITFEHSNREYRAQLAETGLIIEARRYRCTAPHNMFASRKYATARTKLLPDVIVLNLAANIRLQPHLAATQCARHVSSYG